MTTVEKKINLPSQERLLQKASRRLRRQARAAHIPPQNEETMSKKTKLEMLEQEERLARERAEQPPVQITDVLTEAEARHDAEMVGPDAPEWARVVVNDPSKVTTDRRDVQVALAQLDAEEKELNRKLTEGLEKKRAILNQILADQKAAEERTESAKALPNDLKDVLTEVRSFREPDAPPVVVFEDPIQRGKDALDRSLRRMHGEDVPEPEYAPLAPRVSSISSTQDALRTRVAPALATAAALQKEIARWSRDFGKVFDDYYVVGEDDANREVQLIKDLMRGMPSTTALLQKQSVDLVRSILRVAQMTVQSKTSMENTLDRESKHLTRMIERADWYGPMVSRGDRSVAFYDLRRELETTLSDLGTVTAESVAGLWDAAEQMKRNLSQIAKARASVEGVPQPPLEWENRGAIIEGVEIARSKEKADWNQGDRRRAPDAGWSPFATGSSHKENV